MRFLEGIKGMFYLQPNPECSSNPSSRYKCKASASKGVVSECPASSWTEDGVPNGRLCTTWENWVFVYFCRMRTAVKQQLWQVSAMLSGVILVVFLICYCCHRNMRKSGRGSQYWHEEPEVPLEVFTVDGQCYEVAGVFLTTDSCASFDTLTCPQTPSPPPPYEAVVADKKDSHVDEPKTPIDVEVEDSSGLPSYEAALRLEAQGYV
ncbi:uncharacterized protein s-cup [Anabrus simplex]|uniref:uncharacterized protein s-cup n=1 Tax=Anabrus simplex TaxID=316456 RepID=UPI0035A2CCCE